MNGKPHALITGACGGIGREICLELAHAGYRLILVGTDEERLQSLASSLPEEPAKRICADLTKENDLDTVCRIMDQYPISAMVLAAGIGSVNTFQKQDRNSIRKMIRLNTESTALLCHAFLNSKSPQHILITGSVAGFAPDPYMAVYGGSKSFTNQFAYSLREESKSRNLPVSVTLLTPGPVRTGFDAVAGCTQERRGLDPKICAKKAVRGLLCGRRTVFANVSAALCYCAMKILPGRFMARVIGRIQRNKMR